MCMRKMETEVMLVGVIRVSKRDWWQVVVFPYFPSSERLFFFFGAYA